MRVQFLDTTCRQVSAVANKLRDSAGVDDPLFDRSAARQIYQWLVAPLEQELQAQGIDNLVFLGGVELRGISLGGLYDGQRFVRERYTIR